MKYFSMFSGVGGFELGIGDMGECIGYSEIDKYSIMTYERHYGHTNYGDATTINERELPDFDLLVGGFPCQAFSIAGKRQGFNEARGTLFFDIARILKHKRPSHFCLENVKGLLSHDSGKTFQVILEVLSDLGYGVEWQLLNGKRWVPQNRERIIIIGHLRERCTRKVLPFRQAGGVYNATDEAEKEVHNIASTQTARQYASWGGNFIKQLNNPVHSNNRVYGDKGLSPALNTAQGGQRQPFVALTETRTDEAKQIRRESQKSGKDWSPRRGKQLVPRNDALSNNITAGQSKEHLLYGNARIRRLTPLECERLMGWEDNWTEGVSDTQRYKQCGNGIIAPMVTEVITALCNEGCLQTEGIS